MDYFSGKDLTHDWTSSHIVEWERALRGKVQQNVSILEVGSFEGRSALFFLQYLPRSIITCVDSFGSPEHCEPASRRSTDMELVERRFDQNLAPFGSRVVKERQASEAALLQLSARQSAFDIVHINGDSRPAGAYFDASLAWRMLLPGGVMILDGYGARPAAGGPKAGVDAFMASIVGEYEILHSGYQMILTKSATDKVCLKLAGREIDSVTAPLVSFVLVNWNYGRYIGATIDSILAQDYPHFECIVVDNGSTDDSREVIQHHVGDDARCRILHLPENLGQLGATLVALNEVKGGFVTFVDSDDLLFPDFASIHLQVHLSTPRSIGVTTSGVAEIDGTGTVLTSQYAHIDLNRPGAAKGLRDASTVLRLSTISDEGFARLHGLTAVIPRWTKGWLWAPGTGNMFRKSVLDLVSLKGPNAIYMRSADGHFLPLSHAFAGTAMVDVPLSAYRIHGENYFVNRESLTGISNGTPEYAAKSRRESYQSVESLLERAKQNVWLLRDSYWRVVDISTRVHSDELAAYYQTPQGVEMFERHAVALRQAVGDSAFIYNICARFGFKAACRILAKGFGGRLPLRTHVRAFRLSRNKRRMKAFLN